MIESSLQFQTPSQVLHEEHGEMELRMSIQITDSGLALTQSLD